VEHVDPALVERAADVLRAGGLVAFPTETVYGLGADATDADAVRRIFTVKGRPAGHPLIVHVADLAGLEAVGVVTPAARRLAQAFWPGPLTVLVRRRTGGPGAVCAEVTGGRDTVAVRAPDHPIAQSLLRAAGRPLAAPSANRFGRVSPTRAEHVRADLGEAVDLVLDGGPCAVGVESTIVDCTVEPPEVLRVGGIAEGALAAVLGVPAGRRAGASGVPGTHESHYAPAARVVPCEPADTPAVLDEWTATGARVGAVAPAGVVVERPGVTCLGVAADDADYARNLYEWLRAADRAGVDVVVAVLPADEGIGAAVRDRLARASRRP
jgi:L-threonylcarbamoyladenylate synthase